MECNWTFDNSKDSGCGQGAFTDKKKYNIQFIPDSITNTSDPFKISEYYKTPYLLKIGGINLYRQYYNINGGHNHLDNNIYGLGGYCDPSGKLNDKNEIINMSLHPDCECYNFNSNQITLEGDDIKYSYITPACTVGTDCNRFNNPLFPCHSQSFCLSKIDDVTVKAYQEGKITGINIVNNCNLNTSPKPPKPPKTQPPKIQPPKIQPPKTQPPETQPPKTQPSKTQPDATEPSIGNNEYIIILIVFIVIIIVVVISIKYKKNILSLLKKN